MENYNKKFETSVMQLEEKKKIEINEEIIKAKNKEKKLEAEATAADADTSFDNIITKLDDNEGEIVYSKKIRYDGSNHYNFHIMKIDENTISYKYGFSMLKDGDVNEKIEKITDGEYKLTTQNNWKDYTLAEDAANQKLKLIEGLTQKAYDNLLNEI